MNQVEYFVPENLAPFVNCIMTGERASVNSHTNIPLYADGYPGIMFQESENGFYLLPKEKKLSQLFLYGQTLSPISLDVKGKHRYIVVQLYPFASKYLLNIDPKILNDDCFDLLQLDYIDVDAFRKQLIHNEDLETQIQIILKLMHQLIKSHQIADNDRIAQAISIIINSEGQIKIKEVLEKIYMTERTFERNFLSVVGLTPKQFAKIIQFQTSIDKLTKTTYDSLLEIGLDSGFSDQSHFIRTFKRYTGQTPSYYLNQLA